MDYKEKIRELAIEIQRWIADQEYQGEALLHAAVCCDHVGRMRFITGIAKIIENSLPSEKEIANPLGYIQEECKTQDLKWGALRNLHGYVWLGILSEEVGEVAETLNKEQDWLETKIELIQCAAVIVNWIVSVEHWLDKEGSND